MSCTGCADALALGLARCLPCAHELAARRKELTAGLLAKIGPSANDLFTQQQPRARSKRTASAATLAAPGRRPW